MLFNKHSAPLFVSDKNIAIIGTSPQAFFLADSLQLRHHAVTILVSASQLKRYNQLGTFIIKPTKFQTRHTSFTFASSFDISPDFIFLASSPENASADLFFLTATSIKGSKLINLASFYNYKNLSLLKENKEIRAYLNAQFNLEKNSFP